MYEYIDDETALEKTIEELCRERVIGVDLENSRSSTYYGHLSIIQIASSIRLFIIDSMNIPQPVL